MEFFINVDTLDIEENSINKKNIFSLQCIILFTENCKDTFFIDSMLSDDYEKIINCNWRNYNILKEEIKTLNSFNFLLQDYQHRITFNGFTKEFKRGIFLISIIQYLTINQIIETFLDNVFLCSMTFKKQYADSRLYTPIEFLSHDIVHGLRMSLFETENQKYLKLFYEYCKNGELDQDKKYSVLLIIFLQIHELYINFFNFPDEITELMIKNSLQDEYYRFFDRKDLALSIPEKFRDDITNYLDNCIKLYIIEYNKFVQDNIHQINIH